MGEATAVEPHYIRVHDVDACGVALDVEWKCWMHGDQGVWELRRVIESAKGSLPSGFLLHEWVKQYKGKLAFYFECAGLSWAECVIPSRKSFAAQCAAQSRQGVEVPAQPPFLHDEWAIASAGLPVFFVYAAQASRTKVAKHRADRLLRAFLVKLVTPEAARHLSQFPERSVQACAARGMGSQVCEHLAPLVGALSGVDSAPQHLLADALHGLLREHQSCTSAQAILRSLAGSLGAHINAQVPVASWTTDPTATQLLDKALPDKKRRRRIDEDFKKVVATQVVADGRAGTGAAFLRSLGGAASPSASSAWEERVLLESQSAAWLHFATASAVSICIDGIRVGQPAQEMEVCFAWDPTVGVGIWCPPQAPGWMGLPLRIASRKRPTEGQALTLLAGNSEVNPDIASVSVSSPC